MVTTSKAGPSRLSSSRLDLTAVGIWGLVGAIVLYLAIDGGGYDLVVRSQVGVVIWWLVLVAAVFGISHGPALTPLAWTALALFGAFMAWTAIAGTWSLSSERSLQELSRVACYLGVLALATLIYRDRQHAVRHTVNALGAAVFVVAALALISRVRPDLFPAARQSASFLPGAQNRLGWPLNYWNALAALVAFGLPLLLAIATSARTLAARTAAAAAVPVLALCGYLTFSRGGAIAGAIGLIVFLALAPARIPKLATVLATGAGSAVLIAAAAHRSAIERGLATATARHQGGTLLLGVIAVCAVVALAQVGIAVAARHPSLSGRLVMPARSARALLAVVVVVGVAGAFAAGAPTKLSHAWRDFKRPSATALHQTSIARFGTASSNGRYDLWRVAVEATEGHLLGGSGPGTFQLLWLPRAPYSSYVRDAHSLYFQTLSEVGIVGLALLIGFFAVVLAAALRLVIRAGNDARVRAAAALAALVAFLVSAAADWIWQVPALPAAFLLLAAAVLAPSDPGAESGRQRAVVFRVGAVVLAVACLLVIAVPLAVTTAERRSQMAAISGDPALALAAARSAVRLEPGAASAQLQLALALELQGGVRDALAAARGAARDEPQNWSTWLVLSRLDAEAGRPGASLAAFRRARSLNPRSGLFAR